MTNTTVLNSSNIRRSSFGLKPNPQPTTREPVPAPQGRPFDDALWNRLKAMELDDPKVATPISKRLAAEHKWTEQQTIRAIDEYKRFLYLTQRAGFEVTPSRPVDLVWHEHLMHTRHYWDTLCRDVLQNSLHHNPGTGGTPDADRLQSQYARTLQTYRTTFGIDPPADIWPKPRAAASRFGRGLFALAAFAGLLFAISIKIIPLAIFCFIVLIVAFASFSNANTRKDRGGCGSGCGGGAIGSSGCGDSGGGDGGGDGGGGCGGGGD